MLEIFFDDELESEDLFMDRKFDSISDDSVAAVFSDNEEVDDTGGSSRELLLDETHEYDFILAGCMRLVEPVRVLARES